MIEKSAFLDNLEGSNFKISSGASAPTMVAPPTIVYVADFHSVKKFPRSAPGYWLKLAELAESFQLLQNTVC